jgi:hypothetical protein
MVGKSHRFKCGTPTSTGFEGIENCHFEVSALPRAIFILERSIRKTIFAIDSTGWKKISRGRMLHCLPQVFDRRSITSFNVSTIKAAGRKVSFSIPSLPFSTLFLAEKMRSARTWDAPQKAVDTRLHRARNPLTKKSWPTSLVPIGLLADSLVLTSM